MAPVDEDVGQLKAESLAAFRDAWMALHRLMGSIERYLEKKHGCPVESIEEGTLYSSAKKEVYLYVPACKAKIEGRELEVVNFLKKIRQFAGAFGGLGVKIEALPANAESVLDLASVCEARANSLMSTCTVDLEAMPEVRTAESFLLIVVTDLMTIHKNVKEIVSPV